AARQGDMVGTDRLQDKAWFDLLADPYGHLAPIGEADDGGSAVKPSRPHSKQPHLGGVGARRACKTSEISSSKEGVEARQDAQVDRPSRLRRRLDGEIGLGTDEDPDQTTDLYRQQGGQNNNSDPGRRQTARRLTKPRQAYIAQVCDHNAKPVPAPTAEIDLEQS
ncbi:hypothetical protein LTR94_030800, partial [Friedmanniomyces endolithicus]